MTTSYIKIDFKKKYLVTDATLFKIHNYKSDYLSYFTTIFMPCTKISS